MTQHQFHTYFEHLIFYIGELQNEGRTTFIKWCSETWILYEKNEQTKNLDPFITPYTQHKIYFRWMVVLVRMWNNIILWNRIVK